MFVVRHLRQLSAASIHTSRITAAMSTVAQPAASGLQLSQVVGVLDRFAPPALAESWDNVGLLIEPALSRPIRSILLTNDLTEAVLREALTNRTDLIISYHPPLFKPLTRITQATWKERIVAGCLAHGIALYSPHTAWDAQLGGVNDWLARFARAAGGRCTGPVQPRADDALRGAGRLVQLPADAAGATIGELLAAFKRHIGREHVNVALGVGHTWETRVERVALCAGSGASVLRGATAQLYVTGEMSHHDVLDAVHAGRTVFACNHSNSERGFLVEFAGVLGKLLEAEVREVEGGEAVRIAVAQTDADPLVMC